ncbi:hypothetical protein K470DRAFT_194483, partial [Piedraia hortae CBS 480.64]
PLNENLFKSPNSVIKPWRTVICAQQWQTSAYYYNKQAMKTLPFAAQTAENLLKHYVTMTKKATPGKNTALERKNDVNKVYISDIHAKDYGEKMVVTAFVYDAADAANEAKRESPEKKQAQTG